MKARPIVAVCLSAVLPGCGHIATGRHARGLLLFLLFGFAVDGVLYGHAQRLLPAEQASSGLFYLALTIGIGLWAFGIADTTAIALRARRIEAKAEVADTHIRQALVAYLAEDFEAAAHALRQALRINPHDPDALFYLGVVCADAGRRRRAQRALRQCRRYDEDGKWDGEVHAHLRALEAAPRRPKAPAKAAPPADQARRTPPPEDVPPSRQDTQQEDTVETQP